jgi:hypothetical protein
MARRWILDQGVLLPNRNLLDVWGLSGLPALPDRRFPAARSIAVPEEAAGKPAVDQEGVPGALWHAHIRLRM